MKAFTLLPLVPFVLLASGAVIAQGPVKVAPERYKLVAENDSVRVLRISCPVPTLAGLCAV